MQKQSAHVPTINLARKRGDIVDKIIHWALTGGRVVIILTEFIALSAFIMRFSLDRQIIDLHDKIKQERAVVKLLKHNEDTYRNLQDRLNFIALLDTNVNNTEKTITDMQTTIPADVSMTQFNYTPEQIKFDLVAHSVDSLTNVVNKLKNYPGVTSVSIDKVESKISTATITMAIAVNFKHD